jgi:hypothetical protein
LHLHGVEIKDYVVLQNSQEQVDPLPPPRTLILDFTMTHTRYDRSHLNLNGQLTNKRRSNGPPEPDGVIKTVIRKRFFIIVNSTLIALTPLIFNDPGCS